MFVKKDDLVVVISGDDKSDQPKRVLRSFPRRNKIIVEGVNLVYKHLKPSQKNQQGGRISKEMPIDCSNVMLYSPSLRRGVRVNYRFNADGQKERYCKLSGESFGILSSKSKPKT